MKTNRYAGSCIYCYAHVVRNGGYTWHTGRRWVVAHLSCHETKQAEVTTFELSSGEVLTQNKRGRCEDAPCCGCCTC